MAPRLEYEVKPGREIGQDAHDELELLLRSLHDHGVLRLANDIVAANAEIAKVVVAGLSTEGSMRAIQNLSILLMALSRIEPARFYKVVFALKDACLEVEGHQAGKGGDEAPGLSGAYKMLHDEELWHALAPLIDGLKRFARRLDTDVDTPISAFSGKRTNA